jgi:hypothetical protein
MLSLTLSLTLGLTLSACAPPSAPMPEEAPPPAKTYRVDLPKLLDLKALMPDLKHADGTFRVDGLMMRAEEHFDEALEVTGYVVDVAPRCVRPKRVGEIVHCAQPYVFIAEAVGEGALKMRVTDMKRRDLRKLKLHQKYTFKGVFKTSSKSGYLSSEGLLSSESFRRVKE